MRLSVDSDGADIRVICGPTAAGKSAVALWLAERAASTIISADSRQIYRGFDIGTAKPDRAERAAVPHRGVDVADPSQRYSAAAWADAANGWISEALADGRRPLIAGGTGLYLRALFDGLFDEPESDSTKRGELQAALATLSVSELRRWTQRLDPARAHLGRTQLLRAIEIALLTGQRVSDLHRERATTPRWRPRYLVVDPGPGLAERITARLDDMLSHGWIDEVQRLMQTVSPDAPAWNATGYDVVRRMIRGDVTRAAARETILIHTRQYAKRQRTWFRNQLAPDRVTLLDSSAGNWRETAAAWADSSVRREGAS